MKKERKIFWLGILCAVLVCMNLFSLPVSAEEASGAEFTEEEKEYIRTHRQVTVALRCGFPMICQRGSEEGQYTGIIPDALELLSQITGITFEEKEIPDDISTGVYIETHKNEVIAPFLLNSLISYRGGIEILNTMVESRMIIVGKTRGDKKLTEDFRLVVPWDMEELEQKFQQLFPKARIFYCDSHEDGLHWVRKGRADFTLVNEITGKYLLESPYFEKLQIVNDDSITEDITIGTNRESDPLLISILNKGISAFDGRDIRQILVDNTVTAVYEMSFYEWVYCYRNVILLSVFSLAVLVALVWNNRSWQQQRQEEKKRLEIAEQVHKADLEYQKKMFYQANFDSMTGLYNKTYFVEKAGGLLEKNPETTYAVFLIDLDRFKMINEFYGQEKGDAVLREIGEKLRREVGKQGIYARVYADQFVVFYPADEIHVSSHMINNVLFMRFEGQDIRVQMNVGVYINSSHYKDVNRLLDYARIALENGEDTNGSHFYFFKKDYLERQLGNQKMTNEMERALQEGQFQVFLQPQFEIATNELVGAEALVRWFHPEQGMISPGKFIPVFEKNGFIYKLDVFVCETVCQLLAKWKELGKLIPVSINLSRVDLLDERLLLVLQECLERYGIPTRYLHLEITESAYVENYEEILNRIEVFRDAGFLIEMDDFGSGYSSLNMLKDMPVDVLKLDMKFFDGETHMDRGGSIIGAIVGLAHSLGIRVIAEGVETEREANFLSSIRCRIAQGYRYGKPVPIEEFESLLAVSALGKKMYELAGSNQAAWENLYWKTEKYNVLLRNTGVYLFDYDPEEDCAVFTSMKKEDMLIEKKMAHYAETLSENPTVRPDYRERLKEILQSTLDERVEVEFPANYYGRPDYVWMRASVYRYYREGKLSRIIAILRKKDK